MIKLSHCIVSKKPTDIPTKALGIVVNNVFEKTRFNLENMLLILTKRPASARLFYMSMMFNFEWNDRKIQWVSPVLQSGEFNFDTFQ